MHVHRSASSGRAEHVDTCATATSAKSAAAGNIGSPDLIGPDTAHNTTEAQRSIPSFEDLNFVLFNFTA